MFNDWNNIILDAVRYVEPRVKTMRWSESFVTALKYDVQKTGAETDWKCTDYDSNAKKKKNNKKNARSIRRSRIHTDSYDVIKKNSKLISKFYTAVRAMIFFPSLDEKKK